MGIFWYIARYFHLKALLDHPRAGIAAFALIFAPFWLLGFGAAAFIRQRIRSGILRVLASTLLTSPYFVLAPAAHTFRWNVALVFLGVALAIPAALQISRKAADWCDLAVLFTLGIIVDLGLLGQVWPAGLGGFSKLIMANIGLYGYLVIKPVEGIGYDLCPRWSDLTTGLREFVFYAPIVIPLGFLLGFLHLHRSLPVLFALPSAWVFTFVFVALPEEFFFRGLVQNLLERRMESKWALLGASVIFGLSHFNKGATFNWRYVLLATIAGIFYGRAWRRERRLFASSITHSSVDTVWSLWFK